MGFRTTVILYNDEASTWQNDPKLGQHISRSMNSAFGLVPGPDANFPGGKVVECTHADDQTLAIIDGYDLHKLGFSRWRSGEDTDETALRLLKDAADKLGYRLVKKPTK